MGLSPIFFEYRILKSHRRKAKVYVIRYLEGSKPKRSTRLNEIDAEGILRVGKSRNLRKRIKRFLKDATTKD